MPEKQVINSLKKAGFKSYANTLEGIIPFQGKKAKDVYERFYELVEQREIPNTTVKRASIDDGEYLIISHKVNTEIEVHIAVKTEEYGKDLRIFILFAQYDNKAVVKQTNLGTILTAIGVLFIWTGVGAVALGVGIILLIGAKKVFRSEFEPERNSFNNIILGIFEDACEESEIDFDAKASPS